jgi:putative addiction module component (TIGR02574 family)
MKTVLQLNALTRAEKLRAMEELWEDLSRPEQEYKSPQWHGEVLRARDEALKAGGDEFVPWEEAKKILRKRKR